MAAQRYTPPVTVASASSAARGPFPNGHSQSTQTGSSLPRQ